MSTDTPRSSKRRSSRCSGSEAGDPRAEDMGRLSARSRDDGRGEPSDPRELMFGLIEIEHLGIEPAVHPVEHPATLGMTRVEDDRQEVEVAGRATAVLGRARALAADEPRIANAGLWLEDPLEDDFVTPAVPEVVVVLKRRPRRSADPRDAEPSRVDNLSAEVRVRKPVDDTTDRELIEVLPAPAHRRLDHCVQPLQADTRRHLDPPPDRRTELEQLDPQLVDRVRVAGRSVGRLPPQLVVPGPIRSRRRHEVAVHFEASRRKRVSERDPGPVERGGVAREDLGDDLFDAYAKFVWIPRVDGEPSVGSDADETDERRILIGRLEEILEDKARIPRAGADQTGADQLARPTTPKPVLRSSQHACARRDLVGVRRGRGEAMDGDRRLVRLDISVSAPA